MTFVDKANGILAEVGFAYDNSGIVNQLASKLSNWWNSVSVEKIPSDSLDIKIYKYKKDEKTGEVIEKN